MTGFRGVGIADWSPDGESIAFDWNRGNTDQIYALNLKTQAIIRLTNAERAASAPNWSPDGKSIAFASSVQDGGSQIYFMNSDGTNVRQLTSFNLGNFDDNPVWCPDGSCLVFERNNGRLQLMLLDLRSKQILPLLASIFDTMREEAGVGRSSSKEYLTFAIDQQYYAMDMKSRKVFPMPVANALNLCLLP